MGDDLDMDNGSGEDPVRFLVLLWGAGQNWRGGDSVRVSSLSTDVRSKVPNAGQEGLNVPTTCEKHVRGGQGPVGSLKNSFGLVDLGQTLVPSNKDNRRKTALPATIGVRESQPAKKLTSGNQHL